jgi:hypothetical protein
MRIGVDIDGVLADFCTSYEKLFVDVTGRNTFPLWTPQQGPTSWNWPEEYGYSKEETGEVWRRIKESYGFWSNLQPHLDAVRALQHVYQPLRVRGHEWYFITTRPGQSAKYQTERWLSRWFLNPCVIIAGTGEKGTICQALGIDYFVDDNADNCYDVSQSHFIDGSFDETRRIRTFLISRRYNEYAQAHLTGNCSVAVISTLRAYLDTFADNLMGDSVGF